MSNAKATAESFNKKLLEDGELAQKQEAIRKKKIESEFARLQANQSIADVLKGTNFTDFNEKEIENIQKDFLLEEEVTKTKRTFIRPEFNVVPHAAYQLILVGCKSGSGKSTTAANLALGTINDGKKVLLITNEEAPYDSFNRVTALQNGINFSKEMNLTEAQKKMFHVNMMTLGRQMRVIHENYNDTTGATTTIEGVKNIFLQMESDYKKTGVFFDTVIIDYYQNIKHSIENPNLNEYQVQREFYGFINQFKRRYPASFVVLAQIKNSAKDKDGNELDFKSRIEGTKEIFNAATCALEIRANHKLKQTEWYIRKHRWSGSVDIRIVTGWDKGLYVEYTLDFIEKMAREALASETSKT